MVLSLTQAAQHDGRPGRSEHGGRGAEGQSSAVGSPDAPLPLRCAPLPPRRSLLLPPGSPPTRGSPKTQTWRRFPLCFSCTLTRGPTSRFWDHGAVQTFLQKEIRVPRHAVGPLSPYGVSCTSQAALTRYGIAGTLWDSCCQPATLTTYGVLVPHRVPVTPLKHLTSYGHPRHPNRVPTI